MNDDIEIETGTAGTGMKETMETTETGNAGVTRNQGADAAHPVVVRVPTDDDMRELGRRVALLLHGGDVLLLSGPLGAGKTTFAQGIGAGLGITEPIVSPTFTIARELDGRFADGSHAHLGHVDAYRLGGDAYAPGQDVEERLLDELESLGLDEELEDPGANTVILMEWGEQMASTLAPERLEVHIDRPLDDGQDDKTAERQPTSDGTRVVTLVPVGPAWDGARISRFTTPTA